MSQRAIRANGVHVNGYEPPPSTLAAQIVQNQTRRDAPRQSQDKATFAELLHELLHNNAAVQETNVQVNVKLIDVVAEAGLGPLALDNPFSRQDVLVPQAIDSITVIGSTVGRQPEILFTPVKDGGPQLALSLVARLAAICGRRVCEKLPIPHLLDSVIRAVIASADLWQHAKVLQQVVQGCVDGS